MLNWKSKPFGFSKTYDYVDFFGQVMLISNLGGNTCCYQIRTGHVMDSQ